VPRRTVRIFRKERNGVDAFHVGLVGAGVGANETVMRFADQHVAAHSHNPSRFATDQFNQARVPSGLAPQAKAISGRLNAAQLHDPTLRLGNYLLRHREDVPRFQCPSRFPQTLLQAFREIHSGPDFRDVMYRRNLKIHWIGLSLCGENGDVHLCPHFS
jgi:hypothetical protein